MVKKESYPQGAPTWMDLMTTDPEAAKNFYGGLFGWEFEDMPMDSPGVYTMARIEGDDVAGLGSQPPEMAGMPAVWSVYLAVDDVDAATAKVEEAGGKVAVPAMDVMDQGRMAMMTDPAGATVGLWQAGKQHGAKRKDEPGAFTWNELLAPDFAAALPFYRAVLGLDVQEIPMGDGSTYHCFVADGQQVAGAMAPPMPDAPPHWHVYFHVDDVDATAAKADELGGSVVAPPFEVEGIGKFAVLSDPQGGVFSLMTPAEMAEQPAEA